MDDPQTGTKSQLLYQCSAYYTNTAYYPIVEQLQRTLKFDRGDREDVKLDRLDAFLVAAGIADRDAAPLFAGLLAIPVPEGRYVPFNYSPEKQRDRTAELIVRLMIDPSSREPILIVFEDLHWADPSTIALTMRLADGIGSARALVVLTFRPEFASAIPRHPNATEIIIGNLGAEDAAALAKAVAGGKRLPEEVLAQIVSKTDGVPLFVEELTKTVLESGLLRETDHAFELTVPLPPLAIPSTLQDSLTARLDRLAPVREVAQIGAAIGREFPYELIAAVSSIRGEALDLALKQLVASGLVSMTGVIPDAVFMFKHALVQDAAYDNMLRSSRQRLHALLARTIAERWPQTATARPELLAHHLTLAGLAAEAVPLWLKAGQQANDRYALVEAIAHRTKALQLVETFPESPDKDLTELQVRASLGAAQMAFSGWPAIDVYRTLKPAMRLIELVPEHDLASLVLFVMWTNLATRGEYLESTEVVRKLEELAERYPDSTFKLRMHNTGAINSLWIGNPEESHRFGSELAGMAKFDRDRQLARATNHEMVSGALCCYLNL